MKIIEQSRELSKREKYKMTLDAGVVPMKNVEDGTIIDVDAIVTFEDEKKDGEVVTITSILTDEGNVYAFQSTTFRKSLADIIDIMDGEKFSIIKESGETNAGRPYINCRLA